MSATPSTARDAYLRPDAILTNAGGRVSDGRRLPGRPDLPDHRAPCFAPHTVGGEPAADRIVVGFFRGEDCATAPPGAALQLVGSAVRPRLLRSEDCRRWAIL